MMLGHQMKNLGEKFLMITALKNHHQKKNHLFLKLAIFRQ